MDTQQIVQHLKDERDRLERAILALEGGKASPSTVRKGAKKAGGITPAGRKRLSEMMKKRWAARRKAAKKAA